MNADRPSWSAASLLSSDLSDEALAKSEAVAKGDARLMREALWTVQRSLGKPRSGEIFIA
jgi:hypothetical protein